ncbi:hypothetical protein GCM10010381_61890 [Streptomyces xantholiticus]|nr:hypothetical protein GCM10010381_61890 [Streptomyces xantholiticus]
MNVSLADALVDSYASEQLDGLKAATLTTGGITLHGFLVTPHLPNGRASGTKPPDGDAGGDASDSTC